MTAPTPDPFAMLADRHPALIYVGTDSTFYRLDVGSGPDDPRESALADALLAIAAKRGRP